MIDHSEKSVVTVHSRRGCVFLKSATDDLLEVNQNKTKVLGNIPFVLPEQLSQPPIKTQVFSHHCQILEPSIY